MLMKSKDAFMVKALRRALGYSVTDFSREIGISKQTLSHIEHGEYRLTPRVYKLLEEAVRRILNGKSN